MAGEIFGITDNLKGLNMVFVSLLGRSEHLIFLFFIFRECFKKILRLGGMIFNATGNPHH